MRQNLQNPVIENANFTGQAPAIQLLRFEFAPGSNEEQEYPMALSARIMDAWTVDHGLGGSVEIYYVMPIYRDKQNEEQVTGRIKGSDTARSRSDEKNQDKKRDEEDKHPLFESVSSDGGEVDPENWEIPAGAIIKVKVDGLPDPEDVKKEREEKDQELNEKRAEREKERVDREQEWADSRKGATQIAREREEARQQDLEREQEEAEQEKKDRKYLTVYIQFHGM